MKIRLAALLFTALLTLTALPIGAAFAEDGSGATPASSSAQWSDVQNVALWSIVGIAGSAVLLSVLYLFKRRVGGFPEHPAWVAPISIQLASQLPGDEPDPHAATAGDIHGGHAPAH
jgi:hypothetical protein